MAKVNNVKDIRTAEDVIKWAEKKGAKICEGGNHTKIKVPNQRPIAVPRHKGDLPIGTCKAIIRQLVLAGLGVLTIVALAIVAF